MAYNKTPNTTDDHENNEEEYIEPIVDMENLPDIDPQDVLKYSHARRKQIVERIFAKGSPKSHNAMRVALLALDGMEATAVAQRKLNLEESISKTNEESSARIGEILQLARSQAGLQTNITINVPPGYTPPVLGADIPRVVPVPGEISQVGSQELSYDSFVDEFNAAKS